MTPIWEFLIENVCHLATAKKRQKALKSNKLRRSGSGGNPPPQEKKNGDGGWEKEVAIIVIKMKENIKKIKWTKERKKIWWRKKKSIIMMEIVWSNYWKGWRKYDPLSFLCLSETNRWEKCLFAFLNEAIREMQLTTID